MNDQPSPLPVRIEAPEDERATTAQLAADINRLLRKFEKLDITAPKRRDLLVRSVEEYLILSAMRTKKKASIESRATEALKGATSDCR